MYTSTPKKQKNEYTFRYKRAILHNIPFTSHSETFANRSFCWKVKFPQREINFSWRVKRRMVWGLKIYNRFFHVEL